jgi:hypothetical protein
MRKQSELDWLRPVFSFGLLWCQGCTFIFSVFVVSVYVHDGCNIRVNSNALKIYKIIL